MKFKLILIVLLQCILTITTSPITTTTSLIQGHRTSTSTSQPAIQANFEKQIVNDFTKSIFNFIKGFYDDVLSTYDEYCGHFLSFLSNLFCFDLFDL